MSSEYRTSAHSRPRSSRRRYRRRRGPSGPVILLVAAAVIVVIILLVMFLGQKPEAQGGRIRVIVAREN